jgi:hypothetical protein
MDRRARKGFQSREEGLTVLRSGLLGTVVICDPASLRE